MKKNWGKKKGKVNPTHRSQRTSGLLSLAFAGFEPQEVGLTRASASAERSPDPLWRASSAGSLSLVVYQSSLVSHSQVQVQGGRQGAVMLEEYSIWTISSSSRGEMIERMLCNHRFALFKSSYSSLPKVNCKLVLDWLRIDFIEFQSVCHRFRCRYFDSLLFLGLSILIRVVHTTTNQVENKS